MNSLCRQHLPFVFLSDGVSHSTKHVSHDWFGESQFYDGKLHRKGPAHKHGRKRRQDDRRPTNRTHRVCALPQSHPARTPTEHQCLYGGRPWVARDTLHATPPKRQALVANIEAEPILLTPQIQEASTRLSDKNTITITSPPQIQERPNRRPSPRFRSSRLSRYRKCNVSRFS